MLRYVLRRLLTAIPTLFVIVTISFFLMRVAPGGPFNQEKGLNPFIKANLERVYHLNEPLWKQYLRYLGDLFQGDFGPSFKYKDFSVAELIAQGFPTSLSLGTIAMAVALSVGLTLGVWAALRQNTIVDYTATGVSMLGIAVPNFVVAPTLTLVFGLMLGWLPVGGWGSPANYVLPVVALCLPQIAAIARLTRASMIEVLGSNFVRTARAKGMPERVTITRHAIRAALLPVVSYLGPAIAQIITGSVVIEQIFSIPGIGTYLLSGITAGDVPVIQGCVLVLAVIQILMSLTVDISYALLNPKVRAVA